MQTVAGEADDRHPKFATGAEEAVIAWSAPQVWHPEAKVFINHALNDFFQGRHWNFTHTDRRLDRSHAWKGGSQVIHRLHNSHPNRLPASIYDTAA